eukprot:jgi/Botrbrau1/6521/Bobra.0034s0093.1
MQGWSADAAACVGTLTRLTRLEAPWVDSAQRLMEPGLLTRLTALRTLGLWLGDADPAPLGAALGALPNLRELTLRGRHGLPQGFLAPLQGLTALRLPPGVPVGDHELLAAPLPNLAALEAHLKASPLYFFDTVTVAARLSCVERLALCMPRQSYFAFFPHLAAMTRLGDLRLELYVLKGGGVVTQPGSRALLPQVAFLAGLTRLQSLDLAWVMDASNAAEDVQYLAGLTNLTSLSISGVGRRAEIAELAERGGLLPLTGLRQLSRMFLGGAWRLGTAHKSSLEAALQTARREMGALLGGLSVEQESDSGSEDESCSSS